MKATAFTLLSMTAFAFIFMVMGYLARWNFSGNSWLDIPGALAGYWVLFATPIVVLISARVFQQPSSRSMRSSRFGLSVAVLLLCGWVAVWAFCFFTPSGRIP